MANYKVTDTELTGIANAIRTKGGTQAQLEFPTGFVTAIGNIPTGGEPVLQSKTATQNGTVLPDEGYDGLSSVVVNVQGGGDIEPPLPSAYQRLQYLDFTPSIGIVVSLPSQTAMYTVTFSVDDLQIASLDAFGYRVTNTNNKDFEFRVSNGSTEVYIRSGGNGLQISDAETPQTGEIIQIVGILAEPRETALIGRYAYYNGNNANALDGKFYSIKGVDVITREALCWFVPCRRLSDDVVGVYDHIAETFYSDTYSPTGGSIIAGPDAV